jgi:Bacterial PH domain
MSRTAISRTCSSMSSCRRGRVPNRLPAVTAEPTTGLRFSGTYPAVLICAVVVAVVACPLVLLAFVISSPWRYLWVALVLCATLALILRTLRISLVIKPDGVEVHNFGRSHWLPWAAIESFAPTDGSVLGDGPGEQTLEFVLRSGSRVHAQATFGPPMRYAAELEAMRRHADKWNIQMPEPEATSASI